MKEENHINNILRLGPECNENCLFCNVTRENTKNFKKLSLSEAKRRIRNFAKEPERELSFSGGEPAVWGKDLLGLVSYAKEAGIKRVQIQTNATLIGADYARRLKEAGLDNAFVAFHAPTKAIHEKLTRLPGSFELARAGVKHLLAAGIETTINIVINEWNYELFPRFVAFVKEEFPGVGLISLAVVQPFGNAGKNIYLLPEYRQIHPFLKKGIRLANRSGLAIDNHYCSLPLCFLEKREILEAIEFKENAYLRGSKGEPHPRVRMIQKEKAHTEACFNCYLKNFCNGVWKSYLEKFGEVGIAPAKETLKWWG